MKQASETGTVILAVIKGEMPLSALTDVGIQVHWEDGSYKLVSEIMPVVITPTASDLASGLLTYRASPAELRLWAFFLLAESGGVDLVEVESHPQGDLLINALWDASYNGKAPENAITVAKNLVRRQP
jgi:hypothetical protein